MHEILYIEDKIGITNNYMSLWRAICFQHDVHPDSIKHINLYRDFPLTKWLAPFRNRKAPTWHPSSAGLIREKLESAVDKFKPKLVVSACPASLSVLGLEPEVATLDNLRGGVYFPFPARLELPMLITLPITAWHRSVKEKDLAAANRGFTDQEEFLESELHRISDVGDSDEETDINEEDTKALAEEAGAMWYEPLIVPYGRFVLHADLQKAARLVARAKAHE
jgi:hypothetical protein